MSTVQNRSVVSNQNPAAARGGQARSPGLFGLPGATKRLAQANAPTLAPLAGESPASLIRRQERAAAARSPETQLERAKAFFAAKPAAKQKPVAVAPAAPLALTLKITRERMAVFATLATIEQRPLDEVIAECLADMAAHLTRTRARLHLDEAGRVSLERYLDGLERDEEERAAREGTTPAMLAVAAASDAREAFPHFQDDEAAEYAHRCAGAGYVEATLAMEGC